MSKAPAMLAIRPVALRLPPRRPKPKAGLGPWLRWVRHRNVAESRIWRPCWLLGLVEVVTHPRPRWWECEILELPAVRARAGLPALPARWMVLRPS